MNYKTFNDLNMDINRNLYKIHAGNYDLIVGIPRSGMLAAYIIGLYLNINVTDINSFITNQSLKKSSVRKVKNLLIMPQDAKRILLVDDSIISGNSLSKSLSQIPDQLKDKMTTLVVYSDRSRRDDIDTYLEVLSTPRLFEWNIFHRSILESACVDIDGVLCQDPSHEQNDDGVNYINFLLNAKPHILPSYKIHSIVTSRLEKYRPQTEEWLKKYNIQYENLIKLDLPDKESRLKLNAHATPPASYFNRSKDLQLFIESNGKQAQQIMSITGKPCYSVDDNFMYSPGVINSVLKNPKYLYNNTKNQIAINMPLWLKSLIKPIFSLLIKQNKK